MNKYEDISEEEELYSFTQRLQLRFYSRTEKSFCPLRMTGFRCEVLLTFDIQRDSKKMHPSLRLSGFSLFSIRTEGVTQPEGSQPCSPSSITEEKRGRRLGKSCFSLRKFY